MDPWDVVVWMASLGFVACLVPQFARTVRRRRADDFSLLFLVTVLGASCLALPYMLHAGEYVFALSQGANLIVWGTVLYFRLRPGGAPDGASSPPSH